MPTEVFGTRAPVVIPGVTADGPQFEFELLHRELSYGSQPSAPEWVAIEVWTRNKIYRCTGQFVCVEVFNRDAKASEPDHKALGTRLIGGQRQYKTSMHQTSPLPLRGMNAVFAVMPKDGQRAPSPAVVTTRVERIVYRVLHTAVVHDPNAPDEVTNFHLKSRLWPNK